MKLIDVKKALEICDEVSFLLPTGFFVTANFHITEVGVITKDFVDCGGVVRREQFVNFQLWNTNDLDHRLKPAQLKSIISIYEKNFGLKDLEVEVEHQGDTICKYGLEFNGKYFILLTKQTNCLAPDRCGVTPEKQKVSLSSLQNNSQGCCTPDSNCC